MKAYSKIEIYYFSGTGNSQNVALWISNAARDNGVEAEILNIAQIDRLNINQPQSGSLVVFIAPIHGFNYIPVMMHFIMRFPIGGNEVVLMCSRAGMLLGKFITPGLTGAAFYFSAAVLKTKGYSIKATHPVDLPSNCIILHPGLNQKTIQYIHEKTRDRILDFARNDFPSKINFNSIRENVQDIIMSPVSVAYYCIGRFCFSKTFYASKDCNNCDICINSCPVKAIVKVDNRPFWTYNCESCMKCMGICPQKAIETGHGYFFVFILAFYVVFIGAFYRYFGMYFFEIENFVLKIAVEGAVLLSLFALWYRIVHFLLRFRFFERLIVYTSLTKYKFWGRRYNATKDS